MKLSIDQLELVQQYGHLIVNTGGNDIVELYERDHINVYNNAPVAILQSSVQCQVILLTQLAAQGLLK